MRIPEALMNWFRRWSLMLQAIAALPGDFWKIPGATFEFDDGTDEGFTATPVYDDSGNPYWTFTVSHNEAAQAPSDWPDGSPLHDKVGSLSVYGAAFQPDAKQHGFPHSSKYWRIDAVSPLLAYSKPWQKVQTVEAYVADGYSTTLETSATGDIYGQLSAAILLYVEQNGVRQMLPEVGGSNFAKVKHSAWTKLGATFALPTGATVRNVIVRFRGGWAESSLPADKRPLYEGGIGIDHIAAK